MNNFKDLTGLQFERLEVQARAANGKGGHPQWLCKCDCGNEVIVNGQSLRKGRTKSCGCLNQENRIAKATKHGMAKRPGYHSWANMKDRCFNENNIGYRYYGGRGITVCESWLDFETFWADMGATWQEGLEIDRIDNGGNYEPGNCRWATPVENVSNRNITRRLETPWGFITIAEAAEKSGIPYCTLWYRLKNNWSPEKLFIPKNLKK